MRAIGIGVMVCVLWALIAADRVRQAAPREPAVDGTDNGDAIILAQAGGESLGDPKGPPPLAGPRDKKGGEDRPGPRDRGRPGRGPMGDRPDRSGPGGPDPDFLTPEQVDRLMGFIKENLPQFHERLAAARQNNPAAFRLMIHQAARRLFPIVRMKFENPELAEKMIAEFKAQIVIDDLTQRYRKASRAEREQLKPQLRQHVATRFDMRLERLRIEIRNLQRRLDEAKQELTDQEENKQELIDERLDDLLSDVDRRPPGER